MIKKRQDLEKVTRKKRLYAVTKLFLLTVGLFLLVDLSLSYFKISDSWILKWTKNGLLSESIDKALVFYETYDKPLFVDEYILWRKFIELSQRETIKDFEIDQENPFLRMLNNEKDKSKFELIRKIDSPEELFVLLEKNGYFFDNSFYKIEPSEYEKYLEDPFDDLMLKALYCDVLGYDKLDYELLNLLGRSGNGGYMSTHYLLALLFLKRNGCDKVIGEDMNLKKEMSIEMIVAAIDYSKETGNVDLLSEQLMLLYWSGNADKVRYNWLKFLIETQNDDGGWGLFKGDVSDPHATGLSALSILCYLNGGCEL